MVSPDGAATAPLAVDIQAAQGAGAGWHVATYAAELTSALLAGAAPADDIRLIVSPFEAVPDGLRGAAERSPATVAWIPLPLPAPGAAADDAVVAAAYDALSLAGADYLGLGPLELLRSATTCAPPSAPRWARRVGVVVHDLTPMLLPEQYMEAFSDFERRYRDRLRLCAGADVLATATPYLAEQVPYCLGPTRAVPRAIGLAPPTLPPAGADGGGTGIAHGAVVYAYGPAPQRRPEMLVQAAAMLPPGTVPPPLVFITEPAQEQALRTAAAGAGLDADAVRVVDADQADLLSGLAGALAYAVPSCSEGYDLAALAGPTLGVPVLVPESVGGGMPAGGPDDGEFDPGDARSLADQLQQLITEPGFRERLLTGQRRWLEGRSWAGVAAELRKALAEARPPAGARPTPRRVAPPRVSVTGPLPPVPSGISKYIEDQTRAALGRVRIDWVRSPESPGPAGGRGPVVLDPDDVPDGSLWWHHMANQRRFHYRQFELIAARRGVVELHDVALPFVIPTVMVPPAGVWMPGDLQAELASVYDHGHGSYLDAEEAGIGVLLRWFARHSYGLVVHSAQAKDMVRRHVPDPDVRLWQVPLGSWMSRESRLMARRGAVRLPDRPYVVVPGFIGPAKWPEGVIASVGRIPPATRPLLVFAGMCPPHLEPKLQFEADRREVDLVVTGFLPSEDFDAWLGGAAAAVIARLVIRGETSATVQRATRAGTPTVVAASGSFSDLPADVPLISVVDLAPSAVAARIAAILDSPLASPSSRERREDFEASLPALREAFSWEPTVQLMTTLGGEAGCGWP